MVSGRWCDTARARCYTDPVPTTRPRYTLTDTGAVEEMLDIAQRRWPGVERKELLLRLTAAGRDAVAQELDQREGTERRERQSTAMREGAGLVDAGGPLADAPGRGGWVSAANPR